MIRAHASRPRRTPDSGRPASIEGAQVCRIYEAFRSKPKRFGLLRIAAIRFSLAELD